MTQHQPPFHSRRAFLLAAAALSAASCAREGVETEANLKKASKSFKMGERASVGPITYNVLEANFLTQLGEPGKGKLPENRFLVIRLSITNGAGKEAEIPLLRLVDDQGKEFSESQDADVLSGWFGLIRKIGPTSTEEGRILFDVPARSYKLEVTDGGEAGKEQLAFIEIPIDFDTAEPVPTSGGAQVPSVPSKK